MKIAVIGDLHIPPLQKAHPFTRKERQSFYEAFMEDFFSIPADLYISIGDLAVSESIDGLENIYSIIRRHRKPFVHVLGEHDPYAMIRQEVVKIAQQERFHMMSTDEVVLAFLDTTYGQNHGECGRTLDLVQQQWLETVIEESGNRPLLVFGQHPVNTTIQKSEKGRRCAPPVIPMWELLNNKQGAGLYINGHHHFYSIAAKEQWTFLQIAAVLDEQAVRIIEVSDSLISIDYVPFVIPSIRENARTFGEAISHFKQNPHPLGTEPDVKYTIPLPELIRPSNGLSAPEKEKIKLF